MYSYAAIDACVRRGDVAGHVSGVTDTRFSGLGDRILTASMEDGTARIYSWGPRFSNVKHVVLKVSDAHAADVVC